MIESQIQCKIKNHDLSSCIPIQLPLVGKVQGRKNSEWILDKYKVILDNEKLDKDILSQLKSRINTRYTVYDAIRTEEWYCDFLNSMMAIVDHIMTRK